MKTVQRPERWSDSWRRRLRSPVVHADACLRVDARILNRRDYSSVSRRATCLPTYLYAVHRDHFIRDKVEQKASYIDDVIPCTSRVVRYPVRLNRAATPNDYPESVKQGPKMGSQVMGKVETPEDLDVGDHIFRYGMHGAYSHHGIYIGDGLVIHFTRTENKTAICPSLSMTNHKQQSCPSFPECENQEMMKLGVIKTCVDCFRRDGNKLRSLYRYGYGRSRLGFMLARRGTCTTSPCTKSREQVVKTATQLHADNAFGNYNLLKNNCEHFALFCRTDIRKSEQTAIFGNFQ
ncbi:hypothetical protein NL676_020204 [Syzygium grande]|nr:hypothetical protein NL676_020204 [Syzygium grande]